MINPGDTLENPVTGEHFRFLHTAASSGGELLAFELSLPPGGAVPMPHVHPQQTETFTVLDGEMRFRLGLRHVTSGPGDVVEVAPGVTHGFANAGTTDVRVLVEVRPALAMEAMFVEAVRLASAGLMTRRGLPRDPLDLALFARTYDAEVHAPLIGLRTQRAALALLVGMALRREERRARAVAGHAAVVGEG